jgi:hypothetical protein
MAAAAQCAAPTPKRYQRRRPERTLWYRIVQTHLETWLELASGEDGEAPPAHVERTFRRYLECGILAHGFARAYCDECQHDFLIAYSCKCRGVCPSCNTRRMAETAAHLVDHVFPRHYRCGNGCSPCPSGCVTSCKRTRPCKARCCAFSCPWWNAACASIAPAAPPMPGSGRSPSSTGSLQPERARSFPLLRHRWRLRVNRRYKQCPERGVERQLPCRPRT